MSHSAKFEFSSYYNSWELDAQTDRRTDSYGTMDEASEYMYILYTPLSACYIHSYIQSYSIFWPFAMDKEYNEQIFWCTQLQKCEWILCFSLPCLLLYLFEWVNCVCEQTDITNE